MSRCEHSDLSIGDEAAAAIEQMAGEGAPCEHKWKWERDWIGDPNVINGTQDISGWVCEKCGSTECEDPPEPDPGPDWERPDPAMQSWEEEP